MLNVGDGRVRVVRNSIEHATTSHPAPGENRQRGFTRAVPLSGCEERCNYHGMPLLSNPRRERFAQRVAVAGNGAAAYRHTYGTQGASAEAGASRLLRNDKVRRRVRELQGEAAKAAVMTLEEQRLLLAAVARGEHTGSKLSDRLRAIEIDAKLAGHTNDRDDKSRPRIVPEIIINMPAELTEKRPLPLINGNGAGAKENAAI